MELTVNKAGKYALVWLTNAEKADPKVMDSLQPLIEQCKEKKYRLAIFESGEQDLLEKTTDLLIHNRGLEKTDDGKQLLCQNRHQEKCSERRFARYYPTSFLSTPN